MRAQIIKKFAISLGQLAVLWTLASIGVGAFGDGFASNPKDAELYIKPAMKVLQEFMSDPSRSSDPAEFCKVVYQSFYQMDSLQKVPNGRTQIERSFAKAMAYLEKIQCDSGEVPEVISLESEADLIVAFTELKQFWPPESVQVDDSETASAAQ